MAFGSCYFNKNGKLNGMNAKSVNVDGIQNGLIFNFEMSQTFVHDEPNPQEVSYIFPNDLKICIYDTTFIVGDEVIKPKIKAKEEALKIYKEAVSTGRTAIYGSNIGNGMTEFKIGNISPLIECKVILKMAFIAQKTDENVFYIKFPTDVYTPNGSIGCLDVSFSNFSFKIKCDSEKVKKVTSNVKNFQFDNNTKIFKILNKIENKANQHSIIVTFETYNRIKSSVLLLSENNSNYNYCAVTISPTVQPSNDLNNEFIFVIDCSGSMKGQSIQNARECLQTFIKNLPQKSFFNVIQFGSTFQKLFESSKMLVTKTKKQALEFAQKIDANLGGTEIYNVLSDIFAQPVLNGQRQVFIITDGEAYNVDQILDLAKKNSQNNRCFTIGIGRGCDAGLVEGIAYVTGGKSDFVQVGDSISEKLVPQLQSSIYPSFTSIEIHVPGESNDAFEVSPYPLQRISPNSSSVVILRSKKNKNKNNQFEDGVLITVKYGEKSIEIPINEIEWCNEKDGVGNSFLPLFAFNLLRFFEFSRNLSDSEKRRAEELSISSGVLCKYTGFVGMTNNRVDMNNTCLMKCTIGSNSYRRLCPINCRSQVFDKDLCTSRQEHFLKRKSKQYIFYSILVLIIIGFINFVFSLLRKMKSK